MLVHAQGLAEDVVSTGVADWEVKALGGYSFSPPVATGWTGVGARTLIDGRRFDWGYERGDGESWLAVATLGPAAIKSVAGEALTPWKLRPATLPAMRDTLRSIPKVRYATHGTSPDALHATPVDLSRHLSDAAARWTAMLAGHSPVTIPPHSMLRVILDWDDYVCGYGDLTVTGGNGATIATLWAESLYEAPVDGGVAQRLSHKGDRDQIDGKLFLGMGATFTADGGRRRTFSPLWWDAGRYVAIDITTADDELTIHSYSVRETGYPFDFISTFDASDSRLTGLIPASLRTLEMCSHETYMDCPYYEQLMYVGDTRLQALTTYVMTRDARLAKKSVELFDASRSSDGWTTSRYPSRRWQQIPPFSLWWVCMVHDYAMWRGDLQFVRDRMPGVRAVLDAARAFIRADGLFECPPGWNFVDWVRGHGWEKGIPPGGHGNFGVKGSVNWQAVLAFQAGAALERLFDESALHERNVETARQITAAATRAFWDDARGLLAEDLDGKYFSEHAQCLAVIADALDSLQRQRLMKELLHAGEGILAPCSVYFTHYLFEACRLTGNIAGMIDRLGLWFGFPQLGLKTVLESPEPSRSDCHAWGAHPVFHFYASILGIRPVKPGMQAIHIEPQLGPLDWARGQIPHPAGGQLAVQIRKAKSGRLEGHVSVPPGVTASIQINGSCTSWSDREHHFS
jgi:alpha-L-rhamnosidase